MKLIFIGTGSAFTVGDGNYHSNMLLESASHKKLLIDCGSDARLALWELGLTYKDIQDVYISHLHADHVGGLEWLAFSRKYDRTCSKPCLHASEHLVDDIWNQCIQGGLNSLKDEVPSLSIYFEVDSIKHSFHWEGCEFIPFLTLHTENNFRPLPSYGLHFNYEKKNILITTDTKFVPSRMMHLYEKADLIFHDCETTTLKSGVHATYTELVSLPLAIKNKMWLYHYQPGALPDAKHDGFLGFVKKGQAFDLKNIGKY